MLLPRIQAECQTQDFDVSERKYAPGMHLEKHTHETIVASFVSQGVFLESNSLSQYTCQTGGLSINPAGESHSSRYSRSGSTCLVVSLRAGDQLAEPQWKKYFSRPVYIQNITMMAVAGRICREIRVRDTVTPLMVEGLVLELFALAARETADGYERAPRWLLQIIDYLHANSDHAIQLDELSRIAGVHRTTLCRIFRRHYRLTVGEYIRELRLEKSMKDLAVLEVSIAEVAHAAGFYDQSHFTNAFKRYTGLTPTEFRRR